MNKRLIPWIRKRWRWLGGAGCALLLSGCYAMQPPVSGPTAATSSAFAPASQVTAVDHWETACQFYNLQKSEAALAVEAHAIPPSQFQNIILGAKTIDPLCLSLPSSPAAVASQIEQAAMNILNQLPATYQNKGGK